MFETNLLYLRFCKKVKSVLQSYQNFLNPFISSPEHKVLRVSYCDTVLCPLSVSMCVNIFIQTTSSLKLLIRF